MIDVWDSAAGVDETADTDAVTDLVLGNHGADFGYHGCDFVTGTTRYLARSRISVWQIPANLISIATSCGATSQRSAVLLESGSVADMAPMAGNDTAHGCN